MSDSKQPAPPQPVQVQVGLGAQYVKDFSFENPNAPQIFSLLQNQPQLGMDVDVMSRTVSEGTYEAVLKIKVESKLADKTAFIAELSYAGLFGLPAQLPEDQLKLFLMVEAPRLLFPFARSIIANAVREAGYPNIVLQPIDFMSIYVSQRGSVGTMSAVGAA